MGTDRCTRTTLVTRCCHGAFFGFGFVSTILTITVMFWIAWCYFGLTILQISDSQRRAVVNYSHVSSKPLPTSTTAVPSRSTAAATQEPSINSISKSPTTSSILRGSSRDASVTLSPREAPKKKDTPHVSPGATAAILSGPEEPDDRVYARRVLPSGTENRAEDKSETNRRNVPELENVSRLDITPTKVYATDTAGESLKVENPAGRPGRDEVRTQPRDYVDREKPDPPRRDVIQSSRRPDPEPAYREPDFVSEYPKRYAVSSDRGRYDDTDDEKIPRGRYDKSERGRESDDRYSKGDTRVYPDEKVVDRKTPADEDRYRVRERYPEDNPRRGDDDRYEDRFRNYDEKSRIPDKDETRYRDRDIDRSLPRNDRFKDEERYRYRDDDRLRDRADDRYRPRDDDKYRRRDDRPDDDRYRSRGDDRYIARDEDIYTSRDDERYRVRDDDRYKLRDDDKSRSRDDDRYKYRDDERYRSRDDEKYGIRDDDKYRTKDDDRYRSDFDDRKRIPSRSAAEEERYRLRSGDDKYIDTLTSKVRDLDIRDPVSRGSSILPIGDRKPTSSRSQYDVRTEESVIDRDAPVRDRPRLPVRDEINPSKLSRPAYDEESYRDRDRNDRYRPTLYDEDEAKTVLPTRTRSDSAFSRSTLIDSKLKDEDDSRYVVNPRDRIMDGKFYDKDERDRGIRIQDSKSVISTGESSRRYIDENDRYRTRLPNEKVENTKLNDRPDEKVLDRRSYASEEDEDYRRGVSRTRDYYEDRSRSPTEDSRRRYRDEESYPRRDDELRRDRPKDDIPRDRSKSRDRYDDEYRRYDDKYVSRDDERYIPKADRPYSPERKYDRYPDEEERTRRRDSEIRTVRTDDSRNRDELIRPSASSRNEERYYSTDDFSDIKSSSRRRYEDDLPYPDEYDSKGRDSDSGRHSVGSRRPAVPREPVIGSSMSTMNSREPSDVVTREKRFQSNDNRHQSSRVISNERKYVDPEPDSREELRPLSPKDVIEAAIRHSDDSDQNSRQVHYPVFDPRASNLTSPDIIRPSERRGTTITARKRRSA